MSGRTALWAALGVLAVAGFASSGCDVPVVDDGDETVATTPTTAPASTEPTGPVGSDETRDKTPEDTGPTVPESGGVGVDDYDPELDTPENDLPPPEGSPQADFEQFCDENPDACD